MAKLVRPGEALNRQHPLRSHDHTRIAAWHESAQEAVEGTKEQRQAELNERSEDIDTTALALDPFLNAKIPVKPRRLARAM